MIYGGSGSTKTSQLYHIVKMIHKQTRKKFRLIHSDGGGYAPFVDSGMIDNGIVEVFDFSSRKSALADFRRLGEGYWPRWVKDGKLYSKQVDGSEEYFRTEDVCRTTPQEWEQIGGYVIDGITSTAEVLKNHCSDQTEGVGFKESWKYEEDGYTFTGLQMGHYNIVQKEIHSRLTKGFETLPISWLVCSALVGKGEDKQNRETIYGPQIVGNASTPQVPAWFMDCLHLEKMKYDDIPTKLKKDAKGESKEGMVAWFTSHTDSNTQVPYLCKARIMPEMYPKLLEYFPYGFVPLGYKQGIDLYFQVLELLRKEHLKEMKQ